MVWCPVHNCYINGRKAKIRHMQEGKDPCKWMSSHITVKIYDPKGDTVR